MGAQKKMEQAADQNLHSNMSLFKSPASSNLDIAQVNLHSNMSLFKFSRRCGQKFMRTYLHSNMSLFKFTYEPITANWWTFTFQYVSI